MASEPEHKQQAQQLQEELELELAAAVKSIRSAPAFVAGCERAARAADSVEDVADALALQGHLLAQSVATGVSQAVAQGGDSVVLALEGLRPLAEAAQQKAAHAREVAASAAHAMTEIKSTAKEAQSRARDVFTNMLHANDGDLGKHIGQLQDAKKFFDSLRVAAGEDADAEGDAHANHAAALWKQVPEETRQLVLAKAQQKAYSKYSQVMQAGGFEAGNEAEALKNAVEYFEGVKGRLGSKDGLRLDAKTAEKVWQEVPEGTRMKVIAKARDMGTTMDRLYQKAVNIIEKALDWIDKTFFPDDLYEPTETGNVKAAKNKQSSFFSKFAWTKEANKDVDLAAEDDGKQSVPVEDKEEDKNQVTKGQKEIKEQASTTSTMHSMFGWHIAARVWKRDEHSTLEVKKDAKARDSYGETADGGGTVEASVVKAGDREMPGDTSSRFGSLRRRVASQSVQMQVAKKAGVSKGKTRIDKVLKKLIVRKVQWCWFTSMAKLCGYALGGFFGILIVISLGIVLVPFVFILEFFAVFGMLFSGALLVMPA